MKTEKCDIIQDLLPLYADGCLSEASAKLVDEHLAECEECRTTLAQMKKETKVEVPAINVSAPVNIIKKQVLGTAGVIFAGILAIVIIGFSALSIKYAWPVMHGFTPMDEGDLSVAVEGENVVITPKESDYNRYLFYIYRINDDDTISMFVSFGATKEQYARATTKGTKTAWTWNPLQVRITVEGNGTRKHADYVGGEYPEGGSTRVGYVFDWPTKITLNGNVKEIFYVPQLSEKQRTNWGSILRNYYMTSLSRADYPDGTYYELIPTDGFDFSSLGETILIWSAE